MFDMIASVDIFIPCEKEASFIVNDSNAAGFSKAKYANTDFIGLFKQ